MAGVKQYQEAEDLHRQALEIRLRALVPEHVDVATSLHAVAEFLHELGRTGDTHNSTLRFDEADSLYRQSLRMRRVLLGEDHPDIAEVLNDLAWLYKDRRKLDQAESLYREALAMRQRL